MNRRVAAALSCLGLLLPFSVAHAIWDVGHIAIYADSNATSVCAQVRPGGFAFLPVVATLGPQFTGDLAGAEFRIEVTHPEGWRFTYLPPAGAIALGNALDLLPRDRHNQAGVTLAFRTCLHPDPRGQVSLGNLLVQNDSGGPTELRVKQRSEPSNSLYGCALFTECNPPYYRSQCNTQALPSSCTQFVRKDNSDAGGGCDDPYSVTALNGEVDPRWTTPPRARDYSREVLAFLSRRDWIVLPEEAAEARIEDARIRSAALNAVLQRYGVEWVGKGMPCFDLADTVGVSRTGEIVRLTDWSLLWVFTLPGGVAMQPFIDDLEALPIVGFAEPNGGGGEFFDSAPEVVRFRAPNPLVRQGTLRLSLPGPMPARIEIFDVRGRSVRILADGTLHAGPNDFRWDGRDLAGEGLQSGVYFVRVTAGSHQSLHKLVFIH